MIGLNEENERKLIETVVGVLVDQAVDGTELEYLILSPDEQKELLREKCALLEHEIQVSKERHEREQRNLAARLERLQARLNDTTNTVAETERKGRKRSLFPWRRRG